MFNKEKIGGYVIRFHSIYYLILGIWATFFIESFGRITMHGHEGLDFKMHIIAGAMFIILGLYYLYSIRNKNWLKTNGDIIYLILGISLAMVIVELIYLPQKGLNLFWMDLIEETFIILSLLWILKK
tara:strand:+ start:2598 stop:2978 length:381 start_codon:yes stop_codon:yes gene_type:complete